MTDWQGMRRDTAATGDGTALLVNGRLIVEGELLRRRGYAKLGASTTGGPVLGRFWSPVTGLWVIAFRTSGALEATAL